MTRIGSRPSTCFQAAAIVLACVVPMEACARARNDEAKSNTAGSAPPSAAGSGAAECRVCGCAEGCQSAAGEGTDAYGAPNRANGSTEPLASCGKEDLLERLQTSPDSIDCGELERYAAVDEADAAVRCASDALDAQKPFHLFWRSGGLDSESLLGLVARLENGELRVFHLGVVDEKSFGVGIRGVAVWIQVGLRIDRACTGGPKKCFNVEYSVTRMGCRCMPSDGGQGVQNGEKPTLSCFSM